MILMDGPVSDEDLETIINELAPDGEDRLSLDELAEAYEWEVFHFKTEGGE